MAVITAILAAAAAAASVSAAGFERGTATITSPTGATRVVLQVEIARTAAQRSQGLMGRRALGARAGMVFLYTEPHRGAFWMKDTLIPLDIAFYDGRGRILRIMTMQPCRSDPCPLYDPNVAFRAALEVKAGSFLRWGVRAGDRIILRAGRSG
jgi:uncharacterized protein